MKKIYNYILMNKMYNHILIKFQLFKQDFL